MVIINSTSLQGKRPSNEDREIIFKNLDNSNKNFHNINLYAVFDGHGGDSVSSYLEKEYTKYFVKKTAPHPKIKKDRYQKYICDSYNHIQTKLKNEYKNLANSTGTAALSLIHYKEGKKNKIYAINLGDCRAVLCNKFKLAVPLTKDHKPDNYEETIRIEKLGGVIVRSPGDDPRIEGLSLSRALGDLDTKPYVSHIPEIHRYELDVRDEFLIIGCDGLWDVFENQQAVNFILNKLHNMNKSDIKDNMSNINNIAYLLACEAIRRGSTDNVSVIIVLLK